MVQSQVSMFAHSNLIWLHSKLCACISTLNIQAPSDSKSVQGSVLVVEFFLLNSVSRLSFIIRNSLRLSIWNLIPYETQTTAIWKPYWPHHWLPILTHNFPSLLFLLLIHTNILASDSLTGPCILYPSLD